uniref:Uncharacterized protein n=1 Tax=Urocitellus parryii TaxID=9999 RepID=A0A8D2HMC0_UROPR
VTLGEKSHLVSAACYWGAHPHVPGGSPSCRLAAEPFCIKSGLCLPSPLRTVSIDGDCWICHLIKLDVTCALSDCQNVEKCTVFFFFFFFKQCNCSLIRTEHYSSFMFNLN